MKREGKGRKGETEKKKRNWAERPEPDRGTIGSQ
jgi:hypothetical protein